MATRRRSIALALVAFCLGIGLFAYDDLLSKSPLNGGMVHTIASSIEFVLLGPGMGILAFFICEYLRLSDERLRIERQRAHEARLLFLGRIAASIAHEVRNPLHNLRLLLEEPCRKHGDDALAARVQANLDRINRAVDTVYHLASPGADDPDAIPASDLVPLLREAAAAAAPPPGLVIAIAPGPHQAHAAVDPIVVRIVLDNLLRNAVATGAQRIDMALSSHDRHWLIAVRNPGCLPLAIAAREAALMRTGGPDTEPEPAASSVGLGMGLFISRHLLRRVHGSLTLAQVGEAVEAQVRLPIWSTEP
jgi:signal transduction histidine kinase